MGYLQILELLFGLLPKVITVVQTIETAIPQPGAGVAKLNAVLSTVTAAAAVAPDILNAAGQVTGAVTTKNTDQIATGLTHMISAVVSLFNATGIFKKSASGVAA